ncbi:MAG: pentapeptide repeat-containing protein, partial [Chloroflexi bacterium]|nr:pentapeptide repeat-containing protein [Chloroflexota bacterium]
MEDRWEEIKELHRDRDNRFFYGALLGGIVVAILIFGGGALFGVGRPYEPEGYATNLYTEFISIAVTLFILDTLNRRRDDQRRERELRERLVREARSTANDVAKHAVHELREHGWLEGEDGLLRGADLIGANLGGANLRWANLDGADLWRANLG